MKKCANLMNSPEKQVVFEEIFLRKKRWGRKKSG
jgi:hypothetical protein